MSNTNILVDFIKTNIISIVIVLIGIISFFLFKIPINISILLYKRIQAKLLFLNASYPHPKISACNAAISWKISNTAWGFIISLL